MTSMTDEELADFLGLKKDDPLRAKVRNLPAQARAKYEVLADAFHAVELYDQGLGPKPKGVIVCYPHKRKRRRR